MSVIYIGSGIGGGGIRGRLEQRVRDPQRYFSPASKQAWRSGLTIEGSWAATADTKSTDDKKSTERQEAYLLHEYHTKHGHLPCVVLDGKPIRGNYSPGNQQLLQLKGTPVDPLPWTDWKPLYHVRYSPEESKQLLKDVPTSFGVYRFRLSGSEWGCLWVTNPQKAARLRKQFPGDEPVCLTRNDAVRDYWHRTKRGSREACVKEVDICSKCKVIFPVGTGGKGKRCALCV